LLSKNTPAFETISSIGGTAGRKLKTGITTMITGPAEFFVAGVDWRHDESIDSHMSAGGGLRWCVDCGFGAGREGG
jgi:hypothetical protein